MSFIRALTAACQQAASSATNAAFQVLEKVKNLKREDLTDSIQRVKDASAHLIKEIRNQSCCGDAWQFISRQPPSQEGAGQPREPDTQTEGFGPEKNNE